MTNWQARAREMRQMADELDLWASRTPGRGRTVLGRIADEIRQIADEIDGVYRVRGAPPPPDWVLDDAINPPDEDG